MHFLKEVTQTTPAHLELVERTVTSPRRQRLPWYPKAHRPETPLECPCKPLVGCRDPAQSQPVEQLPRPQGLRVKCYSHQTHRELAGVGLQQDSLHRMTAP